MDTDKMFIILVNIVVITLMIAQANSVMGYLFSVIFAFVEVILLILVLREPRFDARKFYLILNIIVGFLFLVLYLQNRTSQYVSGLGYMLVGSFFIGLILVSFRVKQGRHQLEIIDVEGEEEAHPLEVVDIDDEVIEELNEAMEKPRPPKKNVFLELEKSVGEIKTRELEADLNRQAKALVQAEQQLERITKRLQPKKAPAKRKKVRKTARRK